MNLSIFYDWHDDGPDPKENEHRFGTVRQDYTPKPSFLAAKALIHDLDGYAYRHRLQRVKDTDWTLLFQKGDTDELALVRWSVDPKASEADQTPAVQKLSPNATDVAALRRLASIRFAAGARAESDEKPAVLRVEVRNPESAPATVVIARESRIEVPPGQTKPLEVLLPAGKLRDEHRSVPLPLSWNGQALPALMPLDVVRADPLTLSVAPAGNELVVTIANPARKPLQGRLALVGKGKDLQVSALTLKDADTTVRLPRPEGEQRVELRGADGKILTSLDARRYEPLKPFPADPGTDSGFRYVLHVENVGTPARPLPAVAAPGESPCRSRSK